MTDAMLVSVIGGGTALAYAAAILYVVCSGSRPMMPRKDC